ncbi:hypothetical protein CP335_19010 [Pseudomonas fluorescens]|uniref:Uncharacterized protein n=1 Tax=Pseudomonas fluorescens TaxID=294 RepID=A0A854XDL4_PSEFL|nr:MULTISPECIES: hypothetical protein [Pseudomonas]PCM48115.1 hypothetical protein CP335_19010 [Pseudomonas fluorescens]
MQRGCDLLILPAGTKDQKIAAFGSSYSAYVNLTEISWLAGRHRQQAGFHRRAKAKRMLFTTQQDERKLGCSS